MKYLLLLIVFSVTPYVALNKLVMPQLASLKNVYSHMDKVADQALTSN